MKKLLDKLTRNKSTTIVVIIWLVHLLFQSFLKLKRYPTLFSTVVILNLAIIALIIITEARCKINRKLGYWDARIETMQGKKVDEHDRKRMIR